MITADAARAIYNESTKSIDQELERIESELKLIASKGQRVLITHANPTLQEGVKAKLISFGYGVDLISGNYKITF